MTVLLILTSSYSVFMSLKRVELQMNPKFSTPFEIIHALKRQVCLEKLMMTILSLFVLFLISFNMAW